MLLTDMWPDRHRTGPATPDHTSGKDNYLYADGHVGVVQAATLKKRFDSGEDIARPPE